MRSQITSERILKEGRTRRRHIGVVVATCTSIGAAGLISAAGWTDKLMTLSPSSDSIPLQSRVGVDQVTVSGASSVSNPIGEQLTPARVSERLTGMPRQFIENKGQWPGHVLFASKSGPLSARFERNSVWFDVAIQNRASESSSTELVEHGVQTFSLDFINASGDSVVSGESMSVAKCDYFIGPRSGWRTDVPTYSRLRYEKLYPGIDVVAYDNRGMLEYDVIVHDGSDPSQFVVRCAGMEELVVTDSVVELHSSHGTIRQSAPVAELRLHDGSRRNVECKYRKVGEDAFGLDVAVPRGADLVVDPGITLNWSSFIGGSGAVDYVAGVDNKYNLTAVGLTWSSTFPTVAGYKTSLGGGSDAFICRVDPTQSPGSQLLWSTYFGGSNEDNALALFVNATGKVIVGGWTGSSDFPTVNPFQSFQGGGGGSITACDGFILKYDPALSGNSRLTYSTCVGGSHGIDRVTAVKGGGDGVTFWACGYTVSDNFPTINAAQTQLNQGGGTSFSDGFIVKLDKSQSGSSQLIYGTYWGGGSEDRAWDMDTDGDVVTAVGWTSSNNFPTIAVNQTFGRARSGNSDGFVSRLSTSASPASQPTWSMYYGGSSDDRVTSMKMDSLDVVYITGWTLSNNLPTTTNCYQGTIAGWSKRNAFVAKLIDTATPNTTYCTYLGGSAGHTEGWAIDISTNTSLAVAGFTSATDFPTVAAISTNRTLSGGAGRDVFVSQILTGSSGSAQLNSSTFLGGTANDQVGDEVQGGGYAADSVQLNHGIALDGRVVYVGGWTLSSGFPTVSAFQGTYAGSTDGFLSQLTLLPIPTP